MRVESAKFLEDIRRAGELITRFVEHKDFNDYVSDAFLRSAVEHRQRAVLAGTQLGSYVPVRQEPTSGTSRKQD